MLYPLDCVLAELHTWYIKWKQVPFYHLLDGLDQWSSRWVKSPPREQCVVGAILWLRRFGGDFNFQRDDFCWLKHNYNLEFIPKKKYLLLWNQSIWCTFDSVDHNKAKKHTILGWWRYNQANIVLCDTSMHQLLNTTEIVTCWESSIAVLMKVMNVQVFCWVYKIEEWRNCCTE